MTSSTLRPLYQALRLELNPKKTGGGGSDTPPSRLSSAISSSFMVTCSYLVTFQFKPSNKSWKSHFWNFFRQLWKKCRWNQLVRIIFDKKTEKTYFFEFFWNKKYFSWQNLNSTWKMLSFEVYIVDVAQKLQKLKFFAFFAQIILKR